MMNRKPPFFSIIVPTYNRPKQLGACLRGISQLDYPFDRFEVIVVDDGGTYPLAPVVEPFHKQMEVRLLTQENAGPSAARNAGARRARGVFLAFTDDDCVPDRRWLRALLGRTRKVPGAGMGGRVYNMFPNNPFSTASQLVADYLYAHFNRNPGKACFLMSNNLAVPAEGFRLMGGFDETYPLAGGEDRQFCRVWTERGFPLVYEERAVVHHFHRMDLRGFLRQQANYGRGARRYLKGQGIMGRRSATPQRPSFYVKLLAFPLARETCHSRALMLGLFVLSQLAVASGFLGSGTAPRRPRGPV